MAVELVVRGEMFSGFDELDIATLRKEVSVCIDILRTSSPGAKSISSRVTPMINGTFEERGVFVNLLGLR